MIHICLFELQLINYFPDLFLASLGYFFWAISKAFWNHRHCRWFSCYKKTMTGSAFAAGHRVLSWESLHNITVQERHDLRAGGGFVRAERGFARAVGDAALHRPEDGVGIIGAA